MSSRSSAITQPGIVLSQRADRDHRVELVAARGELDRVGDHLAADQGGLHPLGAHRDPVGDRDRVELHRRAARRADALLDLLGERRGGGSCRASPRSRCWRSRRSAWRGRRRRSRSPSCRRGRRRGRGRRRRPRCAARVSAIRGLTPRILRVAPAPAASRSRRTMRGVELAAGQVHVGRRRSGRARRRAAPSTWRARRRHPAATRPGSRSLSSGKRTQYSLSSSPLSAS